MAGEDAVDAGRPVRGRAGRRAAHLRARPASSPARSRNVVHGTTVATNAVLESKGARVGLITTQGFGQILHLARSQTPGPAGRLDHHDQARPAGLAGRHARGGRADGRARRARSCPSTASRSRASSRDLVDGGVESLTVVAHQRLRRRPPRARDRRRSSRSSTRASRSRSPPTCCPSSASTSAR